MACDCTGSEIFTAVDSAGLAKTPNDLPNFAVSNDLIMVVQDLLLGVNGSGHVVMSEIRDYIKASLDTDEEKIFSIFGDSIYLTYRIRSLGSGGTGRFTFTVPANFSSLNELYMIGTPLAAGAAGPGKSITLTSNYGTDTESTTFNSENQNIIVDTGTVNTFFKLDVSSVFTSLAAGDTCGLEVAHNGVGGNIGYFDLVLKYTRIPF